VCSLFLVDRKLAMEQVAACPPAKHEDRAKYDNHIELFLTLVGYAVGVGNVWRFPYLTYTYGGGAFLVPYLLALVLLGLPLFALELGLGQMLRKGTVGVWSELGLPRLRGVGIAATIATFFLSLYYNVILAWTVYYLGRIFVSLLSTQTLPWDDQMPGFTCPTSTLLVRESLADSPYIIDAATGLFNASHTADFWCPEVGAPSAGTVVNGYSPVTSTPTSCPAVAAVDFWERQVLWQSSGLDELGGMHPGLMAAHLVAWILVYICIFKGISSSGKVVYLTATLPYVALFAFLIRALTLPNAAVGIRFFLEPDLTILWNPTVWIRAAVQIFFSLGVGVGSLVAFGSFADERNDFIGDSFKVAAINSSTSFFAGFVVFPILGYLASEVASSNPCIESDNLADLAAIGLSGTGLAFIAFPIAVSQMPGGFLWAFVFFLMLLCLGIDSEFAMVESVVTVLEDAGYGKKMGRAKLAAVVCFVTYLIGFIFMTRSGLYWFELFDYYTCIVVFFAVTLLECCGLMWQDRSVWTTFLQLVVEQTGKPIPHFFFLMWRYVSPAFLMLLVIISVTSWDVMGAGESEPYPEGSGYYPGWSVWLGWFLGLIPIVMLVVVGFMPLANGDALREKGSSFLSPQEDWSLKNSAKNAAIPTKVGNATSDNDALDPNEIEISTEFETSRGFTKAGAPAKPSDPPFEEVFSRKADQTRTSRSANFLCALCGGFAKRAPTP